MNKKRAPELPLLRRYQMDTGLIADKDLVVWGVEETFVDRRSALARARETLHITVVRKLTTGRIVYVNRKAYALGFRVYRASIHPN